MTIEKTVGIKNACKVLDLTESSLRHLVRKGLLSNLRDDMNRRRFSVAELKKLAIQRAARG